MSTVPSPAELAWRIRWLAGTAVPRTAGATWAPPAPEPEWSVKEVTTWGGKLAGVRHTRSRLRESIRVELDREARRVYVAAQREVGRQFAPPSTLERYWLESAGAGDLLLPSRYTVVGRKRRLLRWRS